MSDVGMTRMILDQAWNSLGERGVERACETMAIERLRAIVTDTVFGMATGERGIPAWLRAAERVLDARR